MEESKGERLCIGIARRRPCRCHFDRNLLFVAIWLVEAASQIKSGRTRSLPLCGSAPSRCRDIATGDAFSCNKWAANFFLPGDVPLYRLPVESTKQRWRFVIFWVWLAVLRNSTFWSSSFIFSSKNLNLHGIMMEFGHLWWNLDISWWNLDILWWKTNQLTLLEWR